jgi:hypothetical protein
MGANSSTALNDITNTVKSSIVQSTSSNIESKASAVCNNIQSFNNIDGCRIDASKGDQLCTAATISHLTASNEATSDTAQDVFNSLKSMADSTTSGTTLFGANVSNASNISKNLVDISTKASLSLNTTCTRNASAVNSHSLENCSGSEIIFGKQTSDVSAIGDCVVSHVASSKSTNKLTNTLDFASTASATGFDVFMIAIVVGVVIIFLKMGGLMAMTMLRLARTRMNSRNRAMVIRQRNRMYAIIFLTMFVLLSGAFWWPGLGSYFLGVWPYHRRLFDDAENGCFRNGSVNKESYMNNFAWLDPFCISSGGSSCTNDDKLKSYEGCGLFAKDGGCDSPEFLTDKADYLEALDACAGLDQANMTFCTANNAAVDVFPTEPNAYEGCTRCTGSTDAEKALSNPRKNFGMFVQDGKSCASGLDPFTYLGTAASPCNPNDLNCVSTIADLLEKSPNDCMDEGYQTRKKRLSERMEACERLNDVTRVPQPSDGSPRRIDAMCPPEAFDFLTKCDESTKACSYIPKDCECPSDVKDIGDCDCKNADRFVVASCKNDFASCCLENDKDGLVCRDEDFKADYLSWKKADDICKELHAQDQMLNPLAPAVTGAVYGLCLIIIIYILIRSDTIRRTAGDAIKEQRSTAFQGVSYTTVLFLMLITGAFGYLIHHSKTFEYQSRPDYNPETDKMGVIGKYGTIVGASLLALYFLYIFTKSKLRRMLPF